MKILWSSEKREDWRDSVHCSHTEGGDPHVGEERRNQQAKAQGPVGRKKRKPKRQPRQKQAI